MIGALLSTRLGRRIAQAVVLAVMIALFLFGLRRSGERAGRAAEQIDHLEQSLEGVRQTIRRASDADVGSGDADDDLRWLRDRARR